MHDDEHAHGPVQPIGTVRVAVSPRALLVTLTGEVDVAFSEELEQAVRAVREHDLPVVVDALG